MGGHSMGGHGAITIGLKNPDKFKSVSAFAPICNPTAVPWGEKAFTGYLVDGIEGGKKDYDACELLKAGRKHPKPILVDQGTKDNFLCGDVNQLKPTALEEACKVVG